MGSMALATVLWLDGIVVIAVLGVLSVLAVRSDPLGGREVCSEPALVAESVLMLSGTLNGALVWESCALFPKPVPLDSDGELITGTIETLCMSVNAVELSAAWLKL